MNSTHLVRPRHPRPAILFLKPPAGRCRHRGPSVQQRPACRFFGPIVLLLAVAGPFGCQGFPYQRSEVVEAKAARAGVRRFEVATAGVVGLSDLTVDAAGRFYAIPERDRVLLRLRLEGGPAGLNMAPIPLDGVPDGMDTEALAWLSDNKFALGTETQAANRTTDSILFLSVQNNRAQVTDSVAFPYSLWQMTAPANQGIEGLCYAGGRLVAAGEPVGHLPDGRRFAPLGRYDARRETWTPYALALTSATGKISGIACRPAANGDLTMLAIERHYGTSRLLRFVLPSTPDDRPIVPEVLVDIARVIEGAPNYEGVAWSKQGDIFLLSDNWMGLRTGPTEGMVVPRTWVP